MDIPTAMLLEEKTANTEIEITNLFASYFKSTYSTDKNDSSSQPTDLNIECEANLFELSVCFDEVFRSSGNCPTSLWFTNLELDLMLLIIAQFVFNPH